MKFILSLVLTLSTALHASTCKRLVDCVTESSKLSGIKYIYPENIFNNQHELNVEMVLNKANAETVLSEALAVFDFMRIPTKVENVWKVIPGADIRYHADLPTYNASKKVTPIFPNNQDPVHLIYQSVGGADASSITMNLRPFLTRFGRIIDLANGMVMVIDRASTISKMLPIIQAADAPGAKKKK